MLVQRFRTPVPLDQLLSALDAGHRERFGYALSPDSYAIAAAMLELEHGTGLVHGVLCLRSVFNDNLGNHDAPASAIADPLTPVFSTVPEREVAADGGEYHAQHVRQAYPDATEGARGFWDILFSRFPDAYDELVAGDPVGFVQALKQEKYFTGSEATYEHFVTVRVASWQAQIAEAGGL